nr:uncharacterized protein LOC123281984 isoform X2 [Equus asinus]
MEAPEPPWPSRRAGRGERRPRGVVGNRPAGPAPSFPLAALPVRFFQDGPAAQVLSGFGPKEIQRGPLRPLSTWAPRAKPERRALVSASAAEPSRRQGPEWRRGLAQDAGCRRSALLPSVPARCAPTQLPKFCLLIGTKAEHCQMAKLQNRSKPERSKMAV